MIISFLFFGKGEEFRYFCYSLLGIAGSAAGYAVNVYLPVHLRCGREKEFMGMAAMPYTFLTP